MKGMIAAGIILLLLAGGSSFVLFTAATPEELLVGRWQEMSWEYEKLDSGEGFSRSFPDEGQKSEICRNMIIHQAEIWEFRRDHQLSLYKGNDKEEISWNLKGRGNILELKHYDGRSEYYQVQEITADSFVILFNFDLQVRGIVKMKFKRT